MTLLPYVVPWLVARAVVATVERARRLRTWRAERRAVLAADLAAWQESTEERVYGLPAVLRGEVPIVPGPYAVDEPPTEEFPIVPASWEHTRESFARLIKDVRNGDTRTLRLRFALEYPTQEYRVVVERNFGVRVTDVGPREITCRVTEGLPTLQEVAR